MRILLRRIVTHVKTSVRAHPEPPPAPARSRQHRTQSLQSLRSFPRKKRPKRVDALTFFLACFFFRRKKEASCASSPEGAHTALCRFSWPNVGFEMRRSRFAIGGVAHGCLAGLPTLYRNIRFFLAYLFFVRKKEASGASRRRQPTHAPLSRFS